MAPTSKTYFTLGLMSGTSLDGLDICLSSFEENRGVWHHSILNAKTVPYTQQLRLSLAQGHKLNGRDLMQLDALYGLWLGQQGINFLEQLDSNTPPIDIIGSHGHTLFHEPQSGFSTQIGSGAHIAAITGIPCVSNFRMGDVARGGQGAPLVPIGDELLFSNYHFCLNLGGFANISYNSHGKRIAFDICPANMAINHIVRQLGKEMDTDGYWGRQGNIDTDLLNNLNRLDYYRMNSPKSLGREWFEAEFLPIVHSQKITPSDQLRTLYEHIAYQIGNAVANSPQKNMLVTGGGAKNLFLMERLKSLCQPSIEIPSQGIVDFKEAHIFGFLALLYTLECNSVLASVTGARTNSIAGCLFR